MSYLIGSVVRLDFDVAVDEVPTDASVTVSILQPDGTATALAPATDTTGSYFIDFVPAQAGRHVARWEASGDATATDEQPFDVRAAYSTAVTVADVKAALNKTLSVDDDELQRMLDAALAEYAEKVGPLPGTVTEYFDGGGQRLVLASANATAITAASYGSGTTISPSDLTVRNGIVDWAYGSTGRFSYGGGQVAITYTVGSLPANHREAIIADVAGYFSATQRGGGAGPSFAGEGYEAPVALNPLVLFPRINALASTAIA